MEQLKMCEDCGGRGENRVTVLDYHSNEYEMMMCRACNGTGRELIFEWSVRVPFGYDRKELGNLDAEIWKVLRAFKDKVLDKSYE